MPDFEFGGPIGSDALPIPMWAWCCFCKRTIEGIPYKMLPGSIHESWICNNCAGKYGIDKSPS